MKKIIKNILLTFVIVFTILNLSFYTYKMISKYYMINDILAIYTGENRDILASTEAEENAKAFIEHMRYSYGEDAPATNLAMLNNYTMGMNEILEVQTVLLMVTVVLSIAIGIILSLTEKSKIKELLDFIITGVILLLMCTIIRYIAGEYKEFKFFEEIIDIISSFGIYYIVAYLVKIVCKYCKNKKSVKELNKELENKNK